MSVCIFFKTYKLVNFYVAMLILKHFQHIILNYFKKSKNAAETHTKIFVQFMDKVL